LSFLPTLPPGRSELDRVADRARRALDAVDDELDELAAERLEPVSTPLAPP
jgi:hypothetical protein